MKNNIIGSVAGGLALLAVLRMGNLKIPNNLFLGISTYTFFLTLGQTFYDFGKYLPKLKGKSENREILNVYKSTKRMVSFGEFLFMVRFHFV